MDARHEFHAHMLPHRFHTPGHKGSLSLHDITEFYGAQPFPDARVTRWEREAAAAYGAAHVRFLTCGSSQGVKAAILAAGGNLLAAADSHRSVADGALLAGRQLFPVQNRVRGDLPMPLEVGDLETAYTANPTAKCVVVTSPDYYGQCSDMRSVAAFCRERGLKLIADSSHGAHFFARPDLFPMCAASVADYTALSAHKTLRAYTQTALVAGRDAADAARLDACIDILGTTSPNYVLLAALHDALTFETANAGGYDALLAGADRIKAAFPVREVDDPMRLVLDASALGLSGGAMYDRLYKSGIGAERYTERYVLCIVTLSNTTEDLDALYAALKRL